MILNEDCHISDLKALDPFRDGLRKDQLWRFVIRGPFLFLLTAAALLIFLCFVAV
jgi:hypothetical protein